MGAILQARNKKNAEQKSRAYAEAAKDKFKETAGSALTRWFFIHHQTGSHANLRHKTKAQLRLVVPRHSGDLAPKTLKSIIMQAEMTVEEFVALLNK